MLIFRLYVFLNYLYFIYLSQRMTAIIKRETTCEMMVFMKFKIKLGNEQDEKPRKWENERIIKYAKVNYARCIDLRMIFMHIILK